MTDALSFWNFEVPSSKTWPSGWLSVCLDVVWTRLIGGGLPHTVQNFKNTISAHEGKLSDYLGNQLAKYYTEDRNRNRTHDLILWKYSKKISKISHNVTVCYRVKISVWKKETFFTVENKISEKYKNFNARVSISSKVTVYTRKHYR